MSATHKRPASLMVLGIVVVTLFAARSANAQAKPGPPDGLGVQVLNLPLPVTGTVNVTSKAPSLFFQSSQPTCDVTNRCAVKFPAVPAGKRLRVTRIHGAIFNTNAAAFIALDRNTFAQNLFVHPLTPFNGAYLGATLSFNEATDIVFEAGETPILELGSGATFDQNSFNRLGITGELIDATP